MRVEYPIALDPDYGSLERLRQPLLAGRLPRGRGGPDPLPPLRRRRLRRVRAGDPDAAARGRRRRRRRRPRLGRLPRDSRSRPTGRTCSRPRRTSAPSRAEACLPARRRSRFGSTSGRSTASGRIEPGARRVRRARSQDRVPLPRQGRQPRPATTRRGSADPVPRTRGRRGAGRRRRARPRRRGPGPGLRAASLPADPPAGLRSPTARSRSSSTHRELEAYVFTFG